MNLNTKNFFCPECESNVVKEIFHYKSKSDSIAYSSVTHEIQCGSCYMDIPSHLGIKNSNISFEEVKKMWFNKYRPAHLKKSARCSICDLYYFEIEKKLQTSLGISVNIFMQKFTKNGNADLICRICEPDNFK